MRTLQFPARIWLALFSLLFSLQATNTFAQSESELRADHPSRYVVQEGDTLWDLAERFLRDPWRWPLIWQANEQVENPHLIFPGDVLVVTSDNMIKVVRLKPKVYVEPLERAIPTIPPHVIQPFLSASLIIEPGELEKAGHVLSGVEDEIIIGKYTNFYARGLANDTSEHYLVFRIGLPINDPETSELLGIEAIHLGTARMDRRGDDVSKLQVIRSIRPIGPQDRLVPIDLDDIKLPYYQLNSPSEKLSGWIVRAPSGVDEVGRYDVVIITGGENIGLEEGHVLKAIYHRGNRKDPLTGEEYAVPDEESGLMMVFWVFDKLSYALVLKAVRSIAVGDRYESP
jgi:hypothetical protein